MSTPEAILIVDDDSLEADLIDRGFRKAGFNHPVRVVTSGDDARSYLRGDGPYAERDKYPLPRLMILDHRMAGESGWDVLRWVRQQPELQTLVVVVFSGSDDPQVRNQALELGANAYHIKPQDSEEYQSTLKRVGEFWLVRPHLT
jgi:CheY-like chemotaxis protein